MKVVGVTACISGVAHTYMAAENLIKFAKKSGFDIKVETQGALGIQDHLTFEEVNLADVVVIISDINIEGLDRFSSCRLVRCSMSYFLHNSDAVIQAIERVRHAPPNTVIFL